MVGVGLAIPASEKKPWLVRLMMVFLFVVAIYSMPNSLSSLNEYYGDAHLAREAFLAIGAYIF